MDEIIVKKHSIKLLAKEYSKLLVSSILSGVLVALGAYVFYLLYAHGEMFFGGVCFSFALIMINYCHIHLFTGKIGQVIDHELPFPYYPVIYVGNFIGALVTGYALSNVPRDDAFNLKLDSVLNTRTVQIGNLYPNASTWYNVIIMAIICGFFVYLAVYSYRKFENHFAKIVGICLSVVLFSLMSAQHCVANMFLVSLMNKWNGGTVLNIFLATIGNAIGLIATHHALKFIDKIVHFKKETQVKSTSTTVSPYLHKSKKDNDNKKK